ncbi:hypothetical protein MNBD_IGNAVI01-2827 [hydrothermal vent metagenome]|uniref:Cell wall-active antibiotics response LiaF-like C-terminal domain-containing protein n=1 Tax=hydrothermal vent metagenome TaxID=652676 RepID=A0A3B1BI28_9ZZZZ
MQNNNSKILIGALLIIIGVFSLAGNFLPIPFHFTHYLFSVPGLMMLFGVIILIKHKNSTGGIILLVVGGYWFLSRYTDLSIKFYVMEYWPILIIILGVYIILRRGDRKIYQNPTGTEDNSDQSFTNKESIDYLDEVSILGGGRRVLVSDNFRGGKVTALLGGIDIDLHECSLAEGTHTIDLTAIFGGVDFIVPRDWKVITNVTSIFGGFDDKRVLNLNQVYESNKVLIIRGFVLFGGGHLKTY